MQTADAAGHVFDATIALSPLDGDTFTGHTHPAYANMVGPFGGAIGATLLNAVMIHPARLGDPVALTVHFAAPIKDGDFIVAAKPMRTNRSTQHWLVELSQEGEVAAYATMVTATRRDTWGTTESSFPDVPGPDSLPPTPRIPQTAWTRSYDMRFIEGGLDGKRSAEEPSRTRLWIRDEPPRPLDFQSLAAICDAFFPRIFVRRPKWIAVGTVALTTYFHADAAQLAAVGTAPVLGQARASRFEQGFFDQSAEVWSAAGTLLAVSHQVVYYKE
ncbi:Thioesterase-like superfamily protein [Noviherbaspirillum humi]|uniref:Thioesterase-like superfamily protein n=1 Tax=Noviherbaspirillum humi TaxID=1688639 RepID=A0A239KPJ7_9BURK|nr:thioesterase family protein [Noviherbaspirillum humi]SNT19479.1 Thioesterase-like superfamily protein [Noviherbaspirillum humi]